MFTTPAEAAAASGIPPKERAELRHNKAFGLLLGGLSASMLGSRITTIAYPMLVLYITRSPVMAGFAVFAATAPSVLFYIPAGALVDRWDPRKTILASEAVRGVAITAMVTMVLLHAVTIWQLIPLSVIDEIFEIFSILAEQRYIRSVVDPRYVPSALVRTEARAHIIVLIGRPLGGLLFELKHALPFIADAVSFAISVISVFRIGRRDECGRAGKVPYRLLIKEVKAGARWLRYDEFTLLAMPLTAMATFISQALIMLFLCEANASHLPSATIGVVLAASGLGGAIGSTSIPWMRFLPRHSWVRIQLCTWAVAFAGIAVTGQRWQILCMAIMMVALGCTGAISNIELNTYVSRHVSQHMHGRVSSLGRLMTFAARAAGPMFGGLLIQVCGARYGIWVLFAMTLALAVVSVRAPAMGLKVSKALLARRC